MTDHASGCATHNEPAYPAGPCDCGADRRMFMAASRGLDSFIVYLDDENKWTRIRRRARLFKTADEARNAAMATLDVVRQEEDELDFI